MSRSYRMTVEITRYNAARRADICAAAEAEWPFSDWEVIGDTLWAAGESSLCGGETEDEFTDRLAQAVWRANEGPCEITVRALDLDDLPDEIYFRDADHYQAWKESTADT